MDRKRAAWTFWIYCALLVWLLFGRGWPEPPRNYWQQVGMNVNLRPLQTVFRYIRLLSGNHSPYLHRHALANLVGNGVLFLPLGYLAPMLWNGFRPLWRCLLWSAGLIIAVELIQLLTLVGRCDVDDLLLNLLGVALGYGAYRLHKWFSDGKT